MRTVSRPRSQRTVARALALAVAAGSLLAAGLAASPAGAATPACRPSQLVTWLNTSPNGAAGTVYYAVNFTDIGNACTLRGYAGVSAVSQDGHQLGSAARRNPGRVRTFTLSGGATAASTVHATVGIVEAGNYPTASCHPATASGLRVYAPNQSSARFLPYPFAACSSRRPSLLSVSPLAAGAGLR